MTALEATGVSVILGGQPIVTQVDLSVAAGEILALVGPNGAGKSTLLAALSGDVPLSAGTVTVAGKPLAEYRAKDLARRRGVQVQEAQLAFAFTAEEVVRMGRAPWAGTEQEDLDDAAVADALVCADVTHLAPRRFPTLSGGEKARVSFARLLAQQVTILLLDEPTAALDVRHQESVLGQVRALADAGAAVVVVVHDLSLAGAYADRIQLMAGGHTRAVGAPRDVLRADLLTDVYEYPVRVIDDMASPGPIVLPLRSPRLAAGTTTLQESS